jgi:hypothetical protein
MNILDFLKKNRETVEKVLGIDDLKQRVEYLEKCQTFDEKDKIINELELKLLKLEKEKSNLEKEYKELELQNRELIFRLEGILHQYKNSPLIRLKEIYDSLSISTKEGLKNIFNSEDALVLFVSGVKEISAIWDYAAYLRREHKDEEFEKVKLIFYLLFGVYKEIVNASYQDVRVGDIFDFKFHIRDNRSKGMSGRIEEIILFGYKENGIIIKKSIVKVK